MALVEKGSCLRERGWDISAVWLVLICDQVERYGDTVGRSVGRSGGRVGMFG